MTPQDIKYLVGDKPYIDLSRLSLGAVFSKPSPVPSSYAPFKDSAFVVCPERDTHHNDWSVFFFTGQVAGEKFITNTFSLTLPEARVLREYLTQAIADVEMRNDPKYAG